jgi:hypothetical protein
VTERPREQRVREIRLPAQRAAETRDRLENHGGPHDPVERVHGHERRAGEQRQEEAADQTHVVIQRQPADDDVIRRELDGAAVLRDLPEERRMRNPDALFQPRRAGRILKERIGCGGDLTGPRRRDSARHGSA